MAKLAKYLSTKAYGDCTGPFGFPMRTEDAYDAEQAIKNQPKEVRDSFKTTLMGRDGQPYVVEGYARRFVLAKAIEFNDGEHADVSIITTDSVDRDREVVLPRSLNFDQFRKNPVVPYSHDYSKPPVGRCQWVTMTTTAEGEGWKAKTRYTPRPVSHPEAAEWFPDTIWQFVREGDMRGKSIGFIPRNLRTPTSSEILARPDWKNAARLIDGATVLEYSPCTLQANPDALVQAVAKARHKGMVISDDTLSTIGLIIPHNTMEKTMPHHLPAVLAPISAEHHKAIHDMSDRVKEGDLSEGGREKMLHCTVDSHIGTEDMGAVKECLKGIKPFRMSLGRTAHFPATQARNCDVVKIDCDSPELKAIHAKLKSSLPHDSELPYRPHITLAYVKPGMGKDYDGMDDVSGLSVKCDSLTFSDHRGQHHTIPLQEDAAPDIQEKAMRESGNAANAVASPGGLVAGNAPEPRPLMPPCPKCMNSDEVKKIPDDIDDDDDRFKCDRCSTEFDRDEAGGDAAASESAEKAAKAMQLNHACVSRAMRLIGQGKVDHGTASAPNGGDRQEDDCLVVDTSKPAKSAARLKYPVISGGSVKAHLVANAEARATQGGLSSVAGAARKLMEAIQADEKSAESRAMVLKNLPKVISMDEYQKHERERQMADVGKIVDDKLESFLVLRTGYRRMV